MVRTSVTPFQASFPQMPTEHGNAPFTFQLYLEKPPHRLGYAKVRDHLLDVTGGTVTKAKRSTPGENQGWTIHVTPDTNADVRIVVRTADSCDEPHAVCTEGGQLLSGDLRDTVYGPAALSVADATVEEAAGAQLEFVVTLSRRRFAETTVEYGTSNGTGPGKALAGHDYTTTEGTLTFGIRENTKTIRVPVLNDSHNEGSEEMTLTLSNPSGARIEDGAATGTIENTDPMPTAWMTRFGRTIGTHVVDALGARLAAESGTHVTVGGISLSGAGEPLEEPEGLGLPTWTDRTGLENQASTMTARELLTRSAFRLSTGERRPGSAAFTAWGNFATSGFDARVDDVDLDGNVTTGLLGADAKWDRGLAGLMLSQSTGDGAYTGDSDTATVESTLTGVYPYAQLELNEQVSVWGLAGLGSGELTLIVTLMRPVSRS